MFINKKTNDKCTLESIFYLSISIFLVIVIVWGLTIGGQTHELLEMLSEDKDSLVLPYLWIYASFAVIAILGGYYRRNASSFRIIVYIFLLSFIPRAIIALSGNYIPTSDFANYYQYGISLRNGDIVTIAGIIKHYGLPNMGGLAVFNGALMSIFSTSVVGFSMANGLITACISVLIYIIGREFDKTIGLVAGLLWAIYPTNILVSSVFDNHHGATLFMLLSVWFLYLSTSCLGWKKWTMVALSSLLTIFSNMLHQSGVLIVVTILVFYMLILFRDIRNNDRHKLITDLFTLGVYLLVYKGVNTIIISVFKACGLVEEAGTSIVIYLDKLVCGLDMKARGMYTPFSLMSLPEEQQISTGIAMLKEDCSSAKELIRLFIDKIDYQWFYSNNLIDFYYDGIMDRGMDNIEMAEKSLNAFKGLDLIWIRIIYLFSGLGIIAKRFKDKKINFMVLFIFGQLLFFMLTETQSRYRYESEPFIMILAAIGVVMVYRYVKTRINAGMIK